MPLCRPPFFLKLRHLIWLSPHVLFYTSLSRRSVPRLVYPIIAATRLLNQFTEKSPVSDYSVQATFAALQKQNRAEKARATRQRPNQPLV